MKLDKTILKKLIKESIEDFMLEQPKEKQKLDVVSFLNQEMIEDAVRNIKDYLVSKKFAFKIARKHSVGELEVIEELGNKDFYKVSELFGKLLQY